jgi:hypothetical protein
VDYVGQLKTKSGQVYSIDKVVATFNLLQNSDVLGLIRRDVFLQFDYRQEFSLNTYEWQFSIKCPGDTSYWLGVGYRGCDGKKPLRCKLEFNPNKVAKSAEFVKIFNYLVSNSALGVEIKRWDLAIDIPVDRRQVTLCKGAGIYEEYWRSLDNRTQYTGQRNQVGRCKLYNKQLESNLDFALTRFEITLDGSDVLYKLVNSKMPVVTWIDAQMVLEDNSEGFNDTELFVLQMCMEDANRLKSLGRKMRKKIECALTKRTHSLVLDSVVFDGIISQLSTYRQVLPVPFVPAVPVEWYKQPVAGELGTVL